MAQSSLFCVLFGKKYASLKKVRQRRYKRYWLLSAMVRSLFESIYYWAECVEWCRSKKHALIFCQEDTEWFFWRTRNRICLKFLLWCGRTSCGNAAHRATNSNSQILKLFFTGSVFCSKLAKSFRIFHLTTFHLEMMNPIFISSAPLFYFFNTALWVKPH